jgi:hypothetical protein
MRTTMQGVVVLMLMACIIAAIIAAPYLTKPEFEDGDLVKAIEQTNAYYCPRCGADDTQMPCPKIFTLSKKEGHVGTAASL